MVVKYVDVAWPMTVAMITNLLNGERLSRLVIIDGSERAYTNYMFASSQKLEKVKPTLNENLLVA